MPSVTGLILAGIGLVNLAFSQSIDPNSVPIATRRMSNHWTISLQRADQIQKHGALTKRLLAR